MRRKLLMILLVVAAVAALTVYVSPRLHLNSKERGVEKTVS